MFLSIVKLQIINKHIKIVKMPNIHTLKFSLRMVSHNLQKRKNFNLGPFNYIKKQLTNW